MFKHVARLAGVAVLALLTSCAHPIGGSGHPNATPTATPMATATVFPVPSLTQEEIDAQTAANAWLATGQDNLTQANAFYGVNGVPFPVGTVAFVNGVVYRFINLHYDGYIYANNGQQLFLFQTHIPGRGRAIVAIPQGPVVTDGGSSNHEIDSFNPYSFGPRGDASCDAADSPNAANIRMDMLVSRPTFSLSFLISHIILGFSRSGNVVTVVTNILRGVSNLTSPAVILTPVTSRQVPANDLSYENALPNITYAC